MIIAYEHVNPESQADINLNPVRVRGLSLFASAHTLLTLWGYEKKTQRESKITPLRVLRSLIVQLSAAVCIFRSVYH